MIRIAREVYWHYLCAGMSMEDIMSMVEARSQEDSQKPTSKEYLERW